MMPMDTLKLHLEIVDWMMTAGQMIRDSFTTPLTITEKSGYRDLVTDVDQGIERFFIEQIRRNYPEHKILGEEGQGDRIASLEGYVWIIDPIDGTMNFIQEQGHFGIMIALYKDGVGLLGYIYDVMNDRLYAGIKDKGAYCNGRMLSVLPEKSLSQGLLHINGNTLLRATPAIKAIAKKSLGTRSIGAASIEAISVFTGRAVGYITYHAASWDIAASMIIAKELGIGASKLDGHDIDLLDSKHKIVLGSERLRKEVIEHLAEDV